MNQNLVSDQQTATRDFTDTFHTLLRSLVDNPRGTDLAVRHLPGRANFNFTCTADDAGKLIGKAGTHLRAIRLITALAGQCHDQEWVATFLEPDGEYRRAMPHRAPPAESHDPSTDLAQLNGLLCALGINAAVGCTGSPRTAYTFTLEPTGHADMDALKQGHEAIYERNQRDKAPLTLVMALGTLLRSIGRRQGVAYRLEVV